MTRLLAVALSLFALVEAGTILAACADDEASPLGVEAGGPSGLEGGTSADGEPPGVPSDGGQLSNEEILAVPATTLEDFATAYEEVLAKSPGLDPSSDAFARLLLNQFRLPKTKSYELGGVKLTKAEWLLVFRHPVFAYTTSKIRPEAEQSAVAAFPEAIDRPAWQTKADAFRHAYWNILMAKRCNLQWAEQFATAHESEEPDGDDKSMDLSNNAAGRAIYEAQPSLSDPEHRSVVRSQCYEMRTRDVALDATRLVYIRGGSETSSGDCCPTRLVGGCSNGAYASYGGGCGIGGFTLSVGTDTLTAAPFGQNASASFSRRLRNVTATGLQVMGRPGQLCTITCALVGTQALAEVSCFDTDACNEVCTEGFCSGEGCQ